MQRLQRLQSQPEQLKKSKKFYQKSQARSMGQLQISQCTCNKKCSISTLTLYHGTTEPAAHLIWTTKTFKGSNGRLGFGGYFCDDKETAKKIGLYRAKQRNEDAAIISCTVKVHACRYKKQKHPKWQGVCQAFFEYCIQKATIQFDAYDVLRNPDKGKYQSIRQRAYSQQADQSQRGFGFQIRQTGQHPNNKGNVPLQLGLLLAVAEHERKKKLQRNLNSALILAALLGNNNQQ